MPTLEAFRVCAPPIQEQRRIAARLEGQLATAERVRAAAQRALDDSQDLESRGRCRTAGRRRSSGPQTQW
jgi:hypothetical protein